MHGFRARVPALDGLRGVAILLVITHHQLIPFSLSGGFLGVDLFFVLSGFLITSLLLKEFDATRTVSLKNFYIRRALRLGPALGVYLAASLIVTYFLNTNDLIRQFQLVGLALAYLTNWRMALGFDSSLDPTAITWSLSIEEQFYIAWPLVLLGCLSAGVKRRHLLVGLSLLICVIMLHRAQLWSTGAELHRLYYGSDTRADAPLMGCLFALIPWHGLPAQAQRVMKIVNVVAMAVLAYLVSTIRFTDQFQFAWGYTVVALLSGVVVWSTANNTSLVTKIFEQWPLRWFGKISYGLYLWHWLLLKTTTFYFLVGATWDPWARFGATLVISAASFYLIELPFNNLKSRFASNRNPAASEIRSPHNADQPKIEPALTRQRTRGSVIIKPSEQNI